jgi:hypothetical protein
MAVTRLPADLFLVEEEKKLHGIFWCLESLSVSALMQRIWVTSASLYRPETRGAKNESNVWSIFAGVHATGRGEE